MVLALGREREHQDVSASAAGSDVRPKRSVRSMSRIAVNTAIDWSTAQDSGGPGLVLRAKHALFDRLVYGRLRAALGGNCHAC